MTGIKICGIRRYEDVDILNKYIPDYAGFIFYPNSKRYINADLVKELVSLLDKRIKTVGVFVNCPYHRVNEIIRYCNLDVAQIHGDEPLPYFKKLSVPFWKAYRIKKSLPNDILAFNNQTILLDSWKDNEYGGTGKGFDLSVLNKISTNIKLILAGGINIDNISEIIDTYRPYLVDVSSSVETNGYKDEWKIKEIIECLKNK